MLHKMSILAQTANSYNHKVHVDLSRAVFCTVSNKSRSVAFVHSSICYVH